MDFLSSLEKDGFDLMLGFGLKKLSKDSVFIWADVVKLLGGEQEKGSICELRVRLAVVVIFCGEYVNDGFD